MNPTSITNILTKHSSPKNYHFVLGPQTKFMATDLIEAYYLYIFTKVSVHSEFLAHRSHRQLPSRADQEKGVVLWRSISLHTTLSFHLDGCTKMIIWIEQSIKSFFGCLLEFTTVSIGELSISLNRLLLMEQKYL